MPVLPLWEEAQAVSERGRVRALEKDEWGRMYDSRTMEVKKCYDSAGMSRALQRRKEPGKIKRENRGQGY